MKLDHSAQGNAALLRGKQADLQLLQAQISVGLE